jgi:hypothetical protein
MGARNKTRSVTLREEHKLKVKNAVYWDITLSLVRTDVSEESLAFIIRVTRIDELGTTAVTSNRSTLGRNTIGERKHSNGIQE